MVRRLFLLLGIYLFVGDAAYAQCPSSPLQNGQTADADDVMAWLNCKAPLANPLFDGTVEATNQGRFKGWYTSGTGPALETGYVSGAGEVIAYDRSLSQYRPLNIEAASLNFTIGGTSGMFMDGSTNVGVGTTSPGSRFTVTQSSSLTGGAPDTYGIQLYDGSNAALTFGYDGSNAYIQSWALKPLYINNQGNNTIINASSGNVGIGTTSPGEKLQVNGNAQVGGQVQSVGGSSGFYPYDRSVGGKFSALYRTGNVTSLWDSDVGNVINYTNSGDVGVRTSSPSYTLHVNGSVAGTSAYVDLSDARLKKNVAPIRDALATLSKVHGVRFQWRRQEERTIGKGLNLPTSLQLGFLAQDLKKAVPEAVAVARDKDHTMSVAASKLVPLLVEAVRELKVANDRQAAEIERLSARLIAVEGRPYLKTVAKEGGLP